jgi:thiopurine S-methyltransferase
LKTYFDQLTDKTIDILIPGCGNGYEAEYLFNIGFKNVVVLDLSDYPLTNLKKRVPDLPDRQLIQIEFFDFEGQFDLIIEQTFFSSLDPSQRDNYASHCTSLLRPGGKLAGVLFDIPLFEDRPPYGGSKELYSTVFNPYFRFLTFEKCYNSIPPRSGNELFMILEKPVNQ